MSVFAVPAMWLMVAGALLVPHGTRGEAPPTVTPQERFGEFGWIGTELRQVRVPNDQTLVIRGTLHNSYNEPIDGVRLIVRLLTAGEKPRELDRIEKELNVVIQPGREVAFNREVATGYSKVFTRIEVVTFAKRRGTTELPPPSHELETQASESREVFFFNGNVPIVNSPIVTPLFSF